MKSLRILILALLALSAGYSWAQPVSHSLVVVRPESYERLQELLSYQNLDIIDGETKWEPRVVALQEDLDFLTSKGYIYEMLHENIEEYYASRLTSTPWATMGGYRTYSEIMTHLDSIHTAHPTITSTKFSIGSTLEGRTMWVMKISSSPNADNGTPEVFFNSLIHAREPAGMEALLNFARWITSNYGIDPMATYLVDNRQIYILPCVNPDGYVYNQTTNPGGGGMWRKNRRNNGGGVYGVDLNRNFGLGWGLDDSGSSPFPSDETYRGPSAFSELETQHLRDFINAHNFVTQNDIHTYQNVILFPWGTSYYPPPGGNGLCPDDATYRMIADSMAYFINSVNGVWYSTGTAWQLLYDVNGGSFDWEYGDASHNKIYAVTTEIGGFSDGFWPPSNRIGPLSAENLPSLIFMARIAGPLAPRPYAAEMSAQCESELNGDGDAIVEPGEGMNLSLTLKNTGLNALTGIQGVITTADPFVSVIQGTSAWPDLNPDATGNNSTLFTLNVAANCPQPYFVSVNLHVTAASLDTNLSFYATVGNSCLYDFVEGGAGDWTTGGSNNQWHISTRRANSPTHAWLSGQDVGNYGDNMNAYLLSPTLIMGPGAQLVYDQWYNLESNFDYGIVEYNTGSGWVQAGTAVTGLSGNWIHTTRPLSIACAGTPVQIRFRMTTDGNTTAEGWYIDNINTGCPPPPSITISAPNGGETWFVGETGSFTWNSTSISENVQIQLNRTYPAGAWETLVASTPNDGSENWFITGPTTSSARVRIRGVTQTTVGDTSNANFTIGQRSLTVIAPNGGEVLLTGSAYNITWSSVLMSENIRIDLNRGYPGLTWETLFASTANDGSQSWSVTGTLTTDARIRVSGVTHTTVGDTSNANFTISQPQVLVISPNGGEVWFIGEDRDITWSSLGVTGNVWIDLNRTYPDGGWETLTTSTPNDGGFNWAVTGPAFTTVRVRVTSLAQPSLTDVSDAHFRIANPNQPPLILHDPLHDQLPAPFTVTADITDDFPGYSAKFFYKPTLAANYDSLVMNPTGNPDEYAVTVGALAVNTYTYYVRALDAMAVASTTAPAEFFVAEAIGSEIVYDDGDPERSNWSESIGMKWAVRFTPSATPFLLTFARIGISALHPDLTHSPLTVEVRLADGPGGAPGTILYSRAEAGSIGNEIGGVPGSPPSFTYVVMKDVNGNPLEVNGDFYISVANPELGKYESFLQDTSGIYSGRSYVFSECDSTWFNENSGEEVARLGNRMIRAGGFPLVPPNIVTENNGADLNLNWTNLHAPFYRIYSALVAEGPYGTFVGSTSDTSFVDVGGAALNRKFYVVHSSTTP